MQGQSPSSQSNPTKADRVKNQITIKFMNQFAVECRFLATLLDPKKGRFDQETLKNGIDALGSTLSSIRHYEPSSASVEGFDRLQTTINFLDSHLPQSAPVLLRRAANLADHICKSFVIKG